MLQCPVCQSGTCQPFFQDSRREYIQCQNCQLVFVPASYHLNESAEKSEYDLHENNLHDDGYRSFLARLCQPMLGLLPDNSYGLDFGCGPGPALAQMFTEQGHTVQLYDKFYYPDESVLTQSFDFITATEVIEHLPSPMKTVNQLWAQIRPGGYLGVMTKLVISRQAFSAWHYKNDPTHISFFAIETFQYIARQLSGASLHRVNKDAFILYKA